MTSVLGLDLETAEKLLTAEGKPVRLIEVRSKKGGKGDDHPLRLGSGQFIPGFEDQIVGHNIGDEFDVNVKFPEDYQMTDYAGKDATFKCKLKSISYEELPEINDDLVKDATEFDTVAEYV